MGVFSPHFSTVARVVLCFFSGIALLTPQAVAAKDPLVRSNGIYSICEAVYAGNEAVLRARIKEGEPVNVTDEQGYTPLHIAMCSRLDNVASIVRILLEAGADIEARDKEGRTALDMAAHSPAKSLLENAMKTRQKELLLFTWLQNGQTEKFLSTLATGVNPNALSKDHRSNLLATAIEKRDEAAALALLDAGADAKKVLEGGVTMLHEAAASDMAQVIQRLLKGGANPLLAKWNGATPLHDAVWNNATQAVQALLPAYAKVRYNPDGGDNGFPICMAVSLGNVDMVTAFLQAGLSPNNPKFAKSPLLIQAVCAGHEDVVRVLAESGANLNARDENNKTALDYAQGSIKQYLQSRLNSH